MQRKSCNTLGYGFWYDVAKYGNSRRRVRLQQKKSQLMHIIMYANLSRAVSTTHHLKVMGL